MVKDQLSPNKFKVVKPWDIDLDYPDFGWGRFFLHNRKIPDLVYTKPSLLIESRTEFLVSQFCLRSRRNVVCFTDSTVGSRTLSCYITASYVFSTGLTAEMKNPKDFIDYAFVRQESIPFGTVPVMQSCSLLTFPCFDFKYPGYQKAIPKIVELLLYRKMHKKAFLFFLCSERIPAHKSEIPEYSSVLSDYFGSDARDLFSDKTTKFVILK